MLSGPTRSGRKATPGRILSWKATCRYLDNLYHFFAYMLHAWHHARVQPPNLPLIKNTWSSTKYESATTAIIFRRPCVALDTHINP
jgi:hypothetical protein